MRLAQVSRNSVVSVVFTLAILALLFPFIVVATRGPEIVAARSSLVEDKFRAASSLQTLRIYTEKLRGAQQALWLDDPRTALPAYSQARWWFEEHLKTAAWKNPVTAENIRRLYDRYVHATMQAQRTGTREQPALLTRDYARLEEYLFRQTMSAYDRAYAAQGLYEAFRARTKARMLELSLGVAAAMILLLALSQLYRVRLQRAADTQIAFLADAAMRDALTGLRNLRAFEEDLPKVAAVAQRGNHALSLMLLDLDEFKAMNDRFGHAAGDRVLKAVARRLIGLREADGAYRLGGDEFAVILPATSAAGAEVAARRLRVPVQRDEPAATMSVGIAQLHAGEALADWRERADIALYEAKRRGGDTAVVYERIENQSRFVSALAISQVRDLLENGDMRVAFQPIWNRATGRIDAFEALARPPARYGFAGPQEAFDAAQRIGHIVELDYLCMESALAQARAHGLEALLFLNVTPATLEHPFFDARSILSRLTAFGMEPGRVVIEITERTIKDLDTVVRSAQALRKHGLRIALDDVGAGSSGLVLLSALPFEFVKIDRTLLLDGNGTKGRAILSGVMAIAETMGAFLIAEGIETIAQLEFAANLGRVGSVRTAGVGGFQGYLLGAPQILAEGAVFEQPSGIARSHELGAVAGGL